MTGGPVRVACFAMGELGHFRRLRSIVAELVQAGADVRVWTDARFADEVRAVGATFVDLFTDRPWSRTDDRSRPIPCRFVTFAGTHGEAVTREVLAWSPALVVYDAFTLVGRVVALGLGVPYVAVLAGHAVHGPSFRARLATDARVDLDPRCLAAVQRLRDVYGLADASPFSYVADPSPWLNLYGEPEPWLTTTERAGLEPLACFGASSREALACPTARPSADDELRVYVAFGTVIWRYFAERALRALDAIATALGDRPAVRVLMSLGGADVPAERVARLERTNVSVVSFVDQWAVLGDVDVFITHHGLGSTHEAIARGVPMVSLPFFWDQPALAARCQELGVALALPDDPSPEAIRAALAIIARDRPSMLEHLARARRWALDAAAERPAIIQRVLALADVATSNVDGRRTHGDSSAR